MTTAPYETPADAAATAKKWRLAGWALIGIGFLIPQVHLQILGEGTAAWVGYELATSFGQMMLPVLITWAATKKGNDLSKAKGTFVVGVLLVLTAGGMAVAKEMSQAETKALVQKALATQEENRAKFDSVLTRMGAIDMAAVLSMESVTNRATRTLALAQVAQYKALLAERKALVANTLAQGQAMAATLKNEEARRGAVVGAENARRQMTELFGELDVVQLAYADSIEALFNWLNTQDGKMQVGAHGQPLFTTQPDLDRFRALAGKVDEQAAAYNAALARYEMKREELAQREQKLKQDAQQFLR